MQGRASGASLPRLCSARAGNKGHLVPLLTLEDEICRDCMQGTRRRPVPAVPPALPSLCSARPAEDVVPPAGTVSPPWDDTGHPGTGDLCTRQLGLIMRPLS